MRIDATSIRRRRSQSWTVYGHRVRPRSELVRTVGHAARTRASMSLVTAQLTYLLTRPRDPALPDRLRQALEPLGAPPGGAVAWLVHHRANTQRTIVHEIDEHGSLLSVVKLGPRGDAGLAHEGAVLQALSPGATSRAVVVPTCLGFQETESGCALRTRLDRSGVVRPPYRWSDAMLRDARDSMLSLRDQLEDLPPELLAAPPGALDSEPSGTPAHGDFTSWNLFGYATRGSAPFAVIDFEQTGLWPEWWDSARLLMSALEEGRIGESRIASAAAILEVGSGAAARYVDFVLRDVDPVDATRRRRRLEGFVALFPD